MAQRVVNSAGSCRFASRCLHIGKLGPDFVMNFSYGTGVVIVIAGSSDPEEYIAREDTLYINIFE